MFVIIDMINRVCAGKFLLRSRAEKFCELPENVWEYYEIIEVPSKRNYSHMVFMEDNQFKPKGRFKSGWLICSKKYFDKTGYIEDFHQRINIKFFEQVSESHFYSKLDYQEAKEYLLQLKMEQRCFV